MLSVLAPRTYRHLFAAQVIALIGTGLLTVALGLLAFRIAGDRAGTILGTALAIKMIAYVLVAPGGPGLTGRLPRRSFLVATDLVRAAIALMLPFVDQTWQIYVLIFVLQSASAAFTPTFQATIPDILPNERTTHCPLALSPCLRPGEPTQPDARRSSPDRGALQRVVRRHRRRLPVLGRPGCVGDLAFRRPDRPPGWRLRPGRRAASGSICRRPRLRGLLALNLAVAAAGPWSSSTPW